ncbi:hypothetical protein K2Z84_33900 [Candidatus Binatia bacterium]|nr:hypothetical protein [Candidatus Binatia bacterium]
MLSPRLRIGESPGVTLLAAALVAGAALHFLGGNVVDPDLWGHVHYGQAILAGDGLPRQDVFSYTAPGAPFYDHEWLSDLVLAALYGAGGTAALIVFKLLVGLLLLLALLDAAARLAERLTPGEAPHPLVVAAVLVTALAVITPGASFRPQLFTMLLLAAELALLLRAERRLDDGVVLPWQLAVLPLAMVPWANLHGGFLVGIGLLGVYCAAHLGCWGLARVRGRNDGLTTRQAGALAATGIAVLLAPLVNPYGTELYAYLAATLDMHGEIREWRPISVLSVEYLRFKLLCVAALGAAAMLLARTSRSDRARTTLAWLVPYLALAAGLSFRHQRHSVLFGIAATPLVVVGVEQVRRAALRRWPALVPRPQVWIAIAGGALAIALVQVHGFATQVARDGMAIRFGRLDYPIDAVEFMRTHGIGGNVAMPFEWGAYAIAKLAPGSRVFIDGRFEAVYPPQVIDDYFAFMHGTGDWERLLDAYPTDVVVVQRWRNIHPRLFARTDLEYVYSDPAALVFVRRSPANAPALERLASLDDRFDFPRNDTVFP